MAAKQIALLGIDGIGKSTVARALSEQLSEHGLRSRIATASDGLQGPKETALQRLQPELWVLIVRMLLSEARRNDGSPAFDELPDTATQAIAQLRVAGLDARTVASNSPDTLRAAAVLEIVRTSIASAEARHSDDDVVIHESYGLKSAIKELALASRLEGGSERLRRDVLEYAEFLRLVDPIPDVYVIHGRTDIARRWRLSQSGGFGPLETFELVGDRSPDSFVSMQDALQGEILELAIAFGWKTIEMLDRPVQENVSSAVAEILGHTLPTPSSTFGASIGVN